MYQQGGPFLAMRGPFITASGNGASVASATAEVTGATEITFNVETSPAAYAGVEWGVSPDYTWSAFSALLDTDHVIIIDASDGVVDNTTYAWRSYATNDPLDSPGNRVYGAGGTVFVPSAVTPILLIINDNAANGTTTFTDQSPAGQVVTPSGTAAYSTTNPPTGMTSSALIGSGATDYLSIANDADFDFGAGDFTIEGYVRWTSVAGFRGVVSGTTNSTADELWITIARNATTLEWYASSANGSWNIASAKSFGTVAANTWYHFALVRNGSSWTPYLDGIAGGGTVSSSATLSFGAGAIYVGTDRTGATNTLNGNICSVRMYKGTALYTANFTPPTLPLPS